MKHHSEYSAETKRKNINKDVPKEIEIKNYAISLRTFWVSAASLLTTAIVGFLLSPNSTQFKSLLEKQDRLYSKDSELVQLSINHIDSIQSTNKELMILLSKTDDIISLNKTEQKRENDFAETTNKGKENIFFMSVESLVSSALGPELFNRGKDWSCYQREYFLNNIKSILASQLDNQYLQQEKTMYADWHMAYDSVRNYFLFKTMFPIEPTSSIPLNQQKHDKEFYDQNVIIRNRQWFNCIAILRAIAAETNNYMLDPKRIARDK